MKPVALHSGGSPADRLARRLAGRIREVRAEPPAASPAAKPGTGFDHRLESLRGVAAMMVAFGHAWLVLDARPWPGVLGVCNGHAAVRLFFVLSGYVLGLALGRMDGPAGRAWGLFTMRRVLRIYPAFLVATLLVTGALALASLGHGNAAASSWFNQFYHETLNWRILRENLLFQSASLNCVTWTLGVEMVGSVFLGFAHFLTRGWPLGGRGILLGGLMALAWWFPQGQVLPYLFMFWLGYLLPQIGPWLTARFKAHRVWSFGLLLLAATIFLRARQTRVELWAEPLGATVLLACLVWGRPFEFYRGLDHPVVRFYGRISYSFYLLHFPVLYALSLVALRLLPAETLLRWPNFAAICLGAASVLAVTPLAWLTYVGVEQPGIRFSKWLGDRWSRRSAARAAAGVDAPASRSNADSEDTASGGLSVRQPSVLFLNRVFPPAEGATGHLLAELTAALAPCGWEVTVLTSRPAGNSKNLLARSRVDGVQVEWEPALPFRKESHWQRALSFLALYPALLLRALLLPRPDVLVVMSDPPMLVVLGAVLRWFTGARLVHWAQDLYPEAAEEMGVLRRASISARLLRWLSSAALARCDQVVVVGECMRARLATRLKASSRLEVIPNWSPRLDPAASSSANKFRERQGWTGRFVVMYSGNFGLAHEFEAILDSAALLALTQPSLLIALVGQGPRRTWVETAVRVRGLNNITLLPRQPAELLGESLAAADLHLATMRAGLCGLVVPSKVYGIVGAGRPCVFLGPRASEAAVLIEGLGCGEVLESVDGAALATCLAGWASDPSRVARAAAAAQTRAAQDAVSLETAVGAFDALLRRVAGANVVAFPREVGEVAPSVAAGGELTDSA